MLESIPWWGWVLLVVVAIIVVPIKLRIMKKMLAGQKKEEPEEDF